MVARATGGDNGVRRANREREDNVNLGRQLLELWLKVAQETHPDAVALTAARQFCPELGLSYFAVAWPARGGAGLVSAESYTPFTDVRRALADDGLLHSAGDRAPLLVHAVGTAVSRWVAERGPRGAAPVAVIDLQMEILRDGPGLLLLGSGRPGWPTARDAAVAEVLALHVGAALRLSLSQRELRQFEAIIDSSDAAIVSKTVGGRITSWNPAAQRLFGYRPDEAIGRQDDLIVPPDRRDELAAIHRTLAAGGHVTEAESVRTAKDGTRVPVSLTISPVAARDGRVVGSSSIMRDISEQQLLLEQLRQAVAARDTFISVASHELKTPLTALQLNLHSLQRRVSRSGAMFDGPQLAAKLDTIERQVARLDHLVDQLLDASRLAVGRLTLTLQEFALKPLVEEVASRFEPEAQHARCPLSCHVGGAPVGVWDRERLDQALSNLIANAIKYGAGAPVVVRVGEDAATVRLAVTDHGPGIAAADRERVFERYERLVSERHFGGLGIGLWLSRQVVAAMGGRIELATAPGEGSTFTIVLPHHPPPPPSSRH